jgi:hypothetical protein
MSKTAITTAAAVARQRFSGSATLTFTEGERGQILDHLDGIILSPVFRNSKRNCALLRYVVERALDGHGDQLKERTIGVEAFGRQADYDTNVDHSVRSAAGEVRRRLAQFYMECGGESDIRIELQPGSYVPQIRFLDRTIVEEPEPRVSVVVPAAPSIAATVEPPRRFVIRGFERPLAIGALAALALTGLALRAGLQTSPTAFDKLWSPILNSPNTALLCFGGGQSATPPPAPATISDYEHLPARNMNVSDAMALVAVTGTLREKNKAFRILNRASTTSFKDLQQGPFILIGALNNEWTLRLTEGLRFTFQRHAPGEGSHIADRKRPENTSWSFRYAAPFADVIRDYAVITRLRDPKTEQIALVVAGLGSWGTQAASEFVTNPVHLSKLERLAPPDWQQKNLQVVIATDIIHGSSGPPTVLAAEFW